MVLQLHFWGGLGYATSRISPFFKFTGVVLKNVGKPKKQCLKVFLLLVGTFCFFSMVVQWLSHLQ